MAMIPTTHTHIEITQMLVRLYLLLSQELDRCLDANAARTFSEQEFQAQLTSARMETLGMLAVNRVVQEKVEHACSRTLMLTRMYQEATASNVASATKDLRTERALLKTKIMTLTDLLAIFRAA